jgi:hypothetical protein
MAGQDDGVSLGAGTVKTETDKALLIELEDLGEERWIPKSVIHADSEVYEASGDGSSGDVVVQQWWADDKGIV